MFRDTVWGVGPGAVDMRSLQNRNLALKRKKKLKQKLLHLAVQMTILPLTPEERRKISPKSPRNPEELSQHAHAKHWERGDNILCQSLIRITQQIFFDEL